MKKFLKTYIKPPLKTIGIYTFIYRLYFFLLNILTALTNLFYKIFYKTAPILLYHRISTPSADPVMLCVTPACFENHLQFLKKNYDVLPLSELSIRLTTGKLEGNEATVTFDDGYRDNLTNALPLLEKYNIPATIFITTNQLGKKASFEWDMKYTENDRATFLTKEEIKMLSSHRLIEIGTHTDKHSRLSNLTEIEQKEDILNGKMVLEKIIGRRIAAFAYPFGGIYDFNNLSKMIVKELGFSFAYSNTQILARKTREYFCIPRINIRECTVSELSQKLLTSCWPSFLESDKSIVE